jgi:hypothetical protein
MRKVIHYKQTNIAQAPDELSKCINKYSSKYQSQVYGFGRSGQLPRDANVYHIHNKDIDTFGRPKIIQYHSEPHMVSLNPTRTSRKLVISQYHATLPEFSRCTHVRNVIDFNSPEYKISPVNKKVRIGFSPSRTTKMGNWHDKGYPQTIGILKKIATKYSNSVEIDIITGVSLPECIRRKSLCNILIDECVTASYHRSGLEGLALGKVTICSFSPAVEKVFLESCGSHMNPFVNVWINSLESKLEELIKSGPDQLYSDGLQNRTWMEAYWSPEEIVSEYTEIYDSL